MASTHIPFFMDGRMVSTRLGGATMDGDLLAFFRLRAPAAHLLANADDAPAAIIVSHKHDLPFLHACRINRWSALSVGGTEQFADFGAAFVERECARGAAGDFAALEPYRRDRCRPPAAAAAAAAMPEVAMGAPRRSRRSPSHRRRV